MWKSQYIKSVKNVIIKKPATKLSISISTALLLWRERKIRTSFKTLWRLKKSYRNDKLLEKITSSSYHMEQKHSSKQVESIKYLLEKNFFAAATFEGL